MRVTCAAFREGGLDRGCVAVVEVERSVLGDVVIETGAPPRTASVAAVTASSGSMSISTASAASFSRVDGLGDDAGNRIPDVADFVFGSAPRHGFFMGEPSLFLRYGAVERAVGF